MDGMRDYLISKQKSVGLNDMERCGLYHNEYHAQTGSGLWYCEYCRARREVAVKTRALMLKLKLGISEVRASGYAGTFVL